MKVKKILAGLSALIMMFSATIGYFPELHRETHFLKASAEEDVSQLSVDESTETEMPEETPVSEAQENTEMFSEILTGPIMPVIATDSEPTEDGWQYTVYNDTVTITGYSGNLTELTIPGEIDGKPVTKIDSYAFADNTTITSVNLNGIQEMGYRIFNGCTSLKSITIPKTLTKIDSYSSSGPLAGSGITSVTFEKGIENIPAYICAGATYLTNVTLPEKEDTIDGYAIRSCAFSGTAISSVTLPDSLTDIGYSAFSGCEQLTKIAIPGNVKIIDGSAFYGCVRLADVTLGNSVEEIGGYAFSDCKRLEKLTMPDSLKIMGYYAFSNCTSLTSVSLGGVEQMGYRIFNGCTSLKKLTIPKTLTETDSYSSGGPLAGSGITSVTFEKGIENIPAYICAGATYLTNVTLPEKEDTIDGYAIRSCAFSGTAISSVTLPDSLTDIGYSAFSGCEQLTKIAIPGNVKIIDGSAFYGCVRLADVTLGNSVEEIGGYAFSDCKRLEKLTMPDSLKIMGYYAFSNCTSLTSVSLGGVEQMGYRIFNGCTSLKKLTIPKTLTETDSYSSGGPLAGSGITSVTFEKGIENIPAYICAGATYLTNVTLPEKEDTIDGYAIRSCAFSGTAISSVTLPDSLTDIGYSAFSGCEQLTKIAIPGNVKIIDGSAFYGCVRLADVTLGNSVEEIGGYAFSDCKRLEKLTMPDSLKIMGYYAFSNCTSLTSVSLGGVEQMGYRIFNGCTSLKKLTIPKTLTETDSYSSGGPLAGSGITSVTFEKGIENIPAYICAGATYLTNVTLPEKEDTIDGYAIRSCAFSGTAISSVTLPDSLTDIGYSAFSGCEQLTKIAIPGNVKIIDGSAFYGCVRLSDITLGKNVAEIGSSAFYECTRLSSVSIKNPECEIYDSSATIPENAGIYGLSGSTAQAYAEKYNRKFTIIEADSEITEPEKTIEKVTEDEEYTDCYEYVYSEPSKENQIASAISSYFRTVDYYMKDIKDVADKGRRTKATTDKPWLKLMEQDQKSKDRMLTFESFMLDDESKKAKEDAYQVLYEFLVESIDAANQEHVIEFDTDLDSSLVEIEADIVNKIYQSVRNSTTDPDSGTGSNGYTVNLNIFGGVFGMGAGEVTITKGNRTYKAVYTSKQTVVANVMNTYMTDLQNEVKQEYKNTCSILYSTFLKKSMIGDVTNDMLKSQLKDLTDDIRAAGFGNVLKNMEVFLECYDNCEDLYVAYKDNDYEAITEMLSEDNKEHSVALYKMITGKKVTDKDVSNAVISRALETVEDSRQNLEDILFDYIYDDANMFERVFRTRTIFGCPVDVDIIDPDTNEVVAYVHDGLSYSSTDDIDIYCMGETKFVDYYTNKKYDVKLTGTDTGTMQILYKNYDENGDESSYTAFYDVPLYDGVIYNQSIDTSDAPKSTDDFPPLKTVDDVTIAASEYNPADDVKSIVKVDCYKTDGGIASGYGEYVKGEAVILTAISDDGYIFDGWYDKDGTLVSKDGNFCFSAVSDVVYAPVFEKELTKDIRYSWVYADDFKDNTTIWNSKDAWNNIYLSVLRENNDDVNPLTVKAIYNNGEELSVKLETPDGVIYESPIIDTEELATIELYNSDGVMIASLENDVIVGDVNKDNKINNKDVVLLQRYIAGGWDVELNEESADINNDGTINNKDVVLLQRYTAGGWDVTIS